MTIDLLYSITYRHLYSINEIKKGKLKKKTTYISFMLYMYEQKLKQFETAELK